MYKKYFLIIAFVIVATTVFAQGRVGSPYTRYGIGDITQSTLIRNNSLGGLSYTLPYSNGINHINPACVGDIDTMTFIFDFGLNGGSRLYTVENPSYSQVKSDFHLSHLNFGFAVTKWWKAAAGVQPFSDVGYSITANDTTLGIDKDYVFAGDGGVNKVFLTNAFQPIKNLTLGVTTSFLFGKIYQSSGLAFNDDSGEFINVFEQNIIRVNDFTFDAGLKYTFELNDNHKIIIGGLYGYNSDLSAERSSIVYHTLTSSTAIVDTVYQADDEAGIVGLPQTIGFGFGYQHTDKFFIGVDYTMQDWTNASFFGVTDNLSNGQSFSMGTEFIPGGKRGSLYNYWQGVSYRAGLHYNQNYYQLTTGQTPINDFGISFGLGLPMKRSRTSFNLSLELGQRGTLENNLIKENYAIFGVSFNLAETWFIKRRID